jgi:Uma2 family endonuclease
MKAVMPSVPPEVLEQRRRSSAGQWDEMWERVLHRAPMPHTEHQDLAGDLLVYLKLHWARPRKAKVYHEVNLAAVGGWPDDYRIPDLVLLSRERFGINRGRYLEGAPDAVVEIHSPDDEAYEKLPFYRKLGVPEVWIIHRDTKEPEVFVLKSGRYRKQRSHAGGWLRSPCTGIELRAGRPGKLAVRVAGDDDTREDLPQD